MKIPGRPAGEVQEANGPFQDQEIAVSRKTVEMSEAVAKGKPATSRRIQVRTKTSYAAAT